MKFSGIFAFAASIALAGTAMAQDASVSAQKTGIKTIAPDLYGNLEVRHTTARQNDTEGDKASDSVNLSVRPQLGTTLFDGAVDTSFVWIFKKEPNDPAVNRATLYNESFWYVLQGKAATTDYKWGPYAYLEQESQKESQFGLQQYGAYGEANNTVSLGSAGSVAFQLISNPVAEFRTQERLEREDTLVPVEGAVRYSLDGAAEEVKTERKDPSYVNLTEVSAKYTVGGLPALSIKPAIEYDQTWNPKYRENANGEIEQDGFKTGSAVLNKLAVTWKFNDAISLTNSLRYNVGGFYQEGINDENTDPSEIGWTTWHNRVILNATLF